MNEDLLKIIKFYGINHQQRKLQEECFELQEAITMYENNNNNNNNNTMYKKHIVEELADVMVVIKQFQYFYDIKDEDIEEVMKYKIERQLKRMKEI